MITFLDLGGYGRLGNQMFQIASTMGIARRIGLPCVFPPWEYARHFKLEIPQSRRRDSLHGYKWQLYEEQGAGYREIVLDPQINWNLHGYFQSWRYFENIKHQLQTVYFAFVGNTTSLPYTSIHVRRGDYEQRRNVHFDLWPDYYREAMRVIEGPYLVFSDDIEWCRKHFKGVVYCHIKDPIDAMHIMSRCQDNIIANSSFSWWAAYLNRNLDKRVIAPNNYVVGETSDDRLPSEWIRV